MNRGWWFCRFRRVLQVVESSCSLVSRDSRFLPVFGRSWTEVGLKFSLTSRLDPSRGCEAVSPLCFVVTVDTARLARRAVRRIGPAHQRRATRSRLLVSNSSPSGGDWKLDEVVAVGDPPYPAEIRRRYLAIVGEGQQRATVQ